MKSYLSPGAIINDSATTGVILKLSTATIVHDYGSNTDDMMKELGGVYRNRQKLRPSINLNRIQYTTYNTHSGLINGRGRFWKTDKTNKWYQNVPAGVALNMYVNFCPGEMGHWVI
jgi:hypothetical protein